MVTVNRVPPQADVVIGRVSLARENETRALPVTYMGG